jgi:HNH endonuclease/Homing endonuclease associated repeat
MKQPFTLQRVPGAPVATDELLADLRRVAELSASKFVTMKLYSDRGKYNQSAIQRRFKSWNEALLAAGLSIANEQDYSDERLFENIMCLWEHYGRQPRLAELLLPPSKISDSPYKRRFRSWGRALEQFVSYANAEEAGAPIKADLLSGRRRTSRDPSLRLRFRVLKRDNFTCRTCGASPAAKLGLQLHVDHIIPWSNGGDTVEENLQTLCGTCNLGKSNVL